MPREPKTADEIVAACMEAMCPHCRRGVAIKASDPSRHVFVEADDSQSEAACEAAPLWSLRGRFVAEAEPDWKHHWRERMSHMRGEVIVVCSRCGNPKSEYGDRPCPSAPRTDA